MAHHVLMLCPKTSAPSNLRRRPLCTQVVADETALFSRQSRSRQHYGIVEGVFFGFCPEVRFQPVPIRSLRMRAAKINSLSRKVTAMSFTKCSAAALLVCLVIGPAPSNAQTNDGPWVQIETTSFMVGIGGQGGDGQLFLPNLGTNCVYPFNISGFGVGIQVGVSRISASGPVKNLTKVEDFRGTYSSAQGEATLVRSFYC